jgi:hypothetical protein
MARFRPEYVAQLMADAGLGVIGSTIFVHSMPAECKKGYLVIEAPGGAPIDQELQGWERHGFQVVARAGSYGEVTEMGDGLVTKIPFKARRPVSGPSPMPTVTVDHIKATHQPMIYPRPDGKGLIEASVNFTYAALISR